MFEQTPLDATSAVYNLRIRRSFIPQKEIEKLPVRPYRTFTVLPLFGERKDSCLRNGDHESRKYGGSLFNARYRFNKHWVIEGTTAVLKEKVNFTVLNQRGCASRSGFDDIVFTTYYNFFPQQKTQMIAHLLAGFPTTKKLSAVEGYDRLVGTKLFSLGGGLEVSRILWERDTQSLAGILQTRFIHFFSRTIPPILPCDDRLHPGNVTDLFAAIHYRYKRHNVETGYDATLYTNGRISYPNQVTKIPFAVRNSFYGSYNYLIRRSGSVGCGASGQFVRSPFHSKGFNVWVAGTILF